MREKKFGLREIFWMVILFCFYYRPSNADDKNRQTFVIRYKDGEQTIPVTVVLDYKKQTEYVINMNPRTPAKSVTLYDFKQRTIAYKDLTNRECFLGRLTYETLNEESNALHDVKSPVESKPKVRSLDPERPALTPTEIRNIAGQKTAVFCRKMNTWLLMPEKTHGIHKRNVDEYEERTYEHHGTYNIQHSHYGKETRRRYRNPDRISSRHRSHRRHGAAKTENQGPSEMERNHFAEKPSVNGIHYNAAKFDDISEIAVQKNSFVNETPHNLEDEKENLNARISSNNLNSNGSNIYKNQFRYQINYPNFKAEFASPSDSVVNEFPSNPNINATDNLKFITNNETSNKDHEIISKYSNESPLYTDKIYYPEKAARHINVRTERATSTTDVPSVRAENQLHNHNIGRIQSQVHQPLQHLLPLYKPLSQEFDFDPPYAKGNETFAQNSNNERNIESEFDPLSLSRRTSGQNKFIVYEDSNNTSDNSDVSTNVLEVQKITKKLENISVDENYTSQPKRNLSYSSYNSIENYPVIPHEFTNDTTFYKSYTNGKNFPHTQHVSHFPNENKDNFFQKIHLRKNPSKVPYLETATATELPIYTTQKYVEPIKSPSNLFPPLVHSTFEITEDLSSFQVYPHDISNEYNSPISLKNDLTLRPLFKSDTREVIENSHVITEQPVAETRYKTGFHHRSDIPSDHNDNELPAYNSSVIIANRNGTSPSAETYVKRNDYSSLTSNKVTDENFSPYQIKYQSVLRDFKPDEIVIDIENIPTELPTPAISDFQERKFVVQPSAKPYPENVIRTDGLHEQVLGTTWRTLIPTTRYPRRRLNDRTRSPVQHRINSQPQKSSVRQNRHRFSHTQPPNQINQPNRAHEFQPIHFSNTQQTYQPRRLNPPRPTKVPSHLNQVNHFNQLSNLPPGVSVHPRHPQAPYADMVLSNRPPTMPLISEHRAVNKPHRQRHHRNKDQLKDSCCRLRGNSVSLQSCCRNGGPCCSRSRRRMQPQNTPCCTAQKAADQIIPSNQIQPLPKNDEMLGSEIQNKERCQKEKMCRTLYESTQKVMVCRNAHIEGC